MEHSLKEIITSFFEHSKERISQPFFGAFIFCVFSYNWDFFYFIYASTDPASTKVALAKSNYLHGVDRVLVPLIFTLLVMYIPSVLNYFRQKTLDYFDGKRKISLYIRKLKTAEFETKIAKNKAEADMQPEIVKQEVAANIKSIIEENNALKLQIEEYKKNLDTKDQNLSATMDQLESLRNSLKFKDEELEKLNQDLNLTMDNFTATKTCDRESIEKLSSENSKLKESIENLNKFNIAITNPQMEIVNKMTQQLKIYQQESISKLAEQCKTFPNETVNKVMEQYKKFQLDEINKIMEPINNIGLNTLEKPALKVKDFEMV